MHADKNTPNAPKIIYLKNYAPPDWRIEHVDLDVDFQTTPETTEATEATVALVRARIRFVRNRAGAAANVEAAADANANTPPLVLDGEALETLAVEVDGKAHPYVIADGKLILRDLPERFTLTTQVRNYPDANTALSGLYRSRDGYFTQCEAEGFRRITWFLDRPDVMATYDVTLHADKARFPVLLANGNPVAAGDEANGRHFATWRDPFKKPCYLFALVAARLEALRDTFTTASGRVVQLAIYVEPGKLDQCAHAMQALQKAMRWDEQRFGLECDLDHYMIVAVSDFNMGAMENKGLNIFNTRYVLARPDVATDADFEHIDRVVAHEYFHNWTGNRVTCRDWFQLSLKEGLTVFRDQEFGADTHDASVARIREVRVLRAVQFPEDAGPMAHPVRPDSYMEINNFYTATVYEKGAEVVRMLQTLIGRSAFRAGMDEYFKRHDGEAVTCDDFVAAMTAASPRLDFDLAAFMRWYGQPGTPQVRAQGEYDATARRYTLSLQQENPKAKEVLGETAAPQLIPVRVALFAADGQELPNTARALILDRARQHFVFEDVALAPTPSLLRDFSAPVTLDFPWTETDLALLLANESDPFAAWEAGQRLASDLILAASNALRAGETPRYPEYFFQAARRLLQTHAERGAAFVAEALSLPGESTLMDRQAAADPDALHAARDGLRRALADALEAEFARCYAALAPETDYRFEAKEAARRALRNLCLAYLLELDRPAYRQLALTQFRTADNMTDQFAALAVLANVEDETCEEREQALRDFYEHWQDEALVVDKWFAVQATSRRPGVLQRVEALAEHPAFDRNNPNKIYALLRAFGGNLVHFHAADGAGYRFLAKEIKTLDRRNPQVAARLARSFDHWKKFDAARQTHSRTVLKNLRDEPGLSRDVFEVIERQLGGEDGQNG